MPYTSDLRGKHLLRDLQNEILEDPENTELQDKLFLRIFDDPSEDNRLWEAGGITFIDPDSNKPLGNNDAAWYTIEDGVPTPLVIVEATFGTERGQFGDGQLNRFSHPLAPAKLGHTAVMLVPFKGESYSKEGGIKGYETDFASLKHAYLDKKIVQVALKITQKESGEYLLIDFYDIELLKSLIIEKAKERLGSKSDASRISSSIQQRMKDYCGIDTTLRNKIETLYDIQGNLIPKAFGYIFTQNWEALTTSSKRDGHGMLGKIIALPQQYPKEKLYAIFLRLNSDEIMKLNQRKGKEVSYVFGNSNIFQVIPNDKLVFQDNNLKMELDGIQKTNLFKNRKNKLIGKIRDGIRNETILIQN